MTAVGELVSTCRLRTAVARSGFVAVLSVLAVVPAAAQSGRDREPGPRPTVEGTAIVTVDEAEYTLPILCYESAVEAGFMTEANRLTRERTGRSNMVRVGVRTHQDYDELVVTLDKYAAWVPRENPGASSVTWTLDMSPTGFLRGTTMVALTRDMWVAGDRPEGLKGARIQARCDYRDPEAPKFRKIG